MDGVASSFWCMFDGGRAERDIEPVPSEDAYSFPEVDYERNPTNLYKQIEVRNWTAVNHFLLTGYWSGSFFSDNTPPSEQACTWVTKYDPSVKRKKVLWTHLPIHAAISFGAPEGVVQLLIKLAPPTLRCADDQRMLPLHLAFRRGSSDATIASIMDVFPEACAVRDYLGRTPAECAAEGPNAKRGTIIQTVLYYNQKAWEKKAAKGQDQQLQAIRETLQQRTERIDNLQTAFDLVRTRENQSREYFQLVMTELGNMKEWYDDKGPEELVENGGVLSAIFVSELTDRFDRLFNTSEALNVQQKKAKKDSDHTLKKLKANWDINGFSEGFKMRAFSEDEKKAQAPENHSLASSVTSLNTTSTGKREAAAKSEELKLEEKKVEEQVEEMFAEKEDAEPQEEPVEAVEEPALADVEVSIKGTPKVVPDVISMDIANSDSESAGEIKGAVSGLTSLDMSDGGVSRSSSKKRSFRLGLAKITKTSSKLSSKSKGNSFVGKTKDNGLPPKSPIKPPKMGILKKGAGSVTPV